MIVYVLVNHEGGTRYFDAKNGYWQNEIDGNCVLTLRRARWRKTQRENSYRRFNVPANLEILKFSLQPEE